MQPGTRAALMLVQNRCQFFTVVVLCWLCILNSHTVNGTFMADTI
eukprot:SAG31_NODE_41554_length_275_cov_1.045455_1_plen_44_part_10